MQITVMLAVLMALAMGETSAERATAGRGAATVGVLLLAVVPGLWTWFGASRLADRLRTGESSPAATAVAARWVRRGGMALWLLGTAGMLMVLGWSQVVRVTWGMADVVLIDELLLIAPVVVSLVLAWAGLYPLERAARERLAQGEASERSQGTSPDRATVFAAEEQRRSRAAESLCGYVAAQVRLMLLPLLLPLLGLLALRDVMRLFWGDVDDARWAAAAMIAMMAMVFACLPWILQAAWSARRLPDGPMRRRLEALLRRAGTPDCRLLYWPTGGMMANAAVVGFVPHVRCVLLTDVLLERLSPEQVEAVVAHELGHLRARHLWLRGAAMLLPLSVWLSLRSLLPATVGQWEAAIQAADTWAVLFLTGALGAYVAIVFGWYARLLEHEADWLACRLLDPANPRAGAAVYLNALAILTDGVQLSRRCRTWQHASVLARAKCLKNLVTDTGYELRFREQIGWLNRLLVGVALGPVAFHLLLG